MRFADSPCSSPRAARNAAVATSSARTDATSGRIVGQKFDRAQLLEHLVAPSKLVEPAFAAWVVEPVDGEEFTALLRERGDGYTVFRDLTGRDVRLADAQVKRASPQQLSLMPEGLLGSLTAQQAADLLAFLASLR
jgi:putative heme-binding domain-containing protein